MKKFVLSISCVLFVLCFSLIAGTAYCDTYVKGYTKKNGTYVQGYTRSDPDKYIYNNKNSQTNGGSQRDEYSSPPAYNKSNPNYKSYIYDTKKNNSQYGLKPNNNEYKNTWN